MGKCALTFWAQDPDLHMQLATSCVDDLLSCLTDESTSKLWRAKGIVILCCNCVEAENRCVPVSSYTSSRSETSFLSYFASTTPDSVATRTRLKTILFLQGSSLYDPRPIRQQLTKHEKLLRFEIAIIDGKVGLSRLLHSRL